MHLLFFKIKSVIKEAQKNAYIRDQVNRQAALPVTNATEAGRRKRSQDINIPNGKLSVPYSFLYV